MLIQKGGSSMADQPSQFPDVLVAEPRPLGLAVAELPILYAKALVPPYAKTFEMEGQRASWGIVWIQILVLIIIPGILGLLRGLHHSARLAAITGTQTTYVAFASIAAGTSIAATLIQIITVPILFFIGVGIQFLLARAFRGTGTFLAQSYATLLYLVPLTILGGIISTLFVYLTPLSAQIVAIPVITLALLIFNILLNITEIAGVHRMEHNKAAAVVLIPYIVAALISCGLIFYLAHAIISALH